MENESIITDKLKEYIRGKSCDDLVDINISMKPDPIELLQDLIAKRDRNPAIDSINSTDRAAILKAIASRIKDEQKGLVNFLSNIPAQGEIVQLWSSNLVGASIPIGALEDIKSRGDVIEIDLNTPISATSLLDTATVSTASKSTNHEILTEYFKTRWHLERMQVYDVWKEGLTGKGVTVAVIDSGINYKHPDLRSQMWVHPLYQNHGINFVKGEDRFDPKDDDGHGTSSASVIAGNGKSDPLRNPPSPLGIAPHATLMAIKIAGFSKTTSECDERSCLRAIEFAGDNDCDLIAMSASMPNDLKPNHRHWRNVCTITWFRGILHINSAGNIGDKIGPCSSSKPPMNIGTPANCPPPWLHGTQLSTLAGGICSVVTCGATDVNDMLMPNSSRGPCEWNTKWYHDYPYRDGKQFGLVKPDLCAPGEAIEVCSPTGTSYSIRPYYGTSAAAACVAGAATLLMQAAKASPYNLDKPARILESLSTQPLRNTKTNNDGTGRINVLRAYLYGVDKNWWK